MAGGGKTILKERERMWKKHGSALLGLILTVAIVLTGVKLPNIIFASDANDKTELVRPTTKVEFRQPKYDYGNGGTITTYEPIKDKVDMSKDILVNVEFDPVFDLDAPDDKRINKGDFVEFDLGQGLNIEDNYQTLKQKTIPVNDKDTGDKICDAIFTVNPSDGTLKVKFDFSTGADAVFKKRDGKIGASITISVDGQTAKYEDSKMSIRLLNKEYEVVNIKDVVNISKVGKLDYINGKIDWTINVERFISGTNPKRYLSLKNYEFEDTLSNRIAKEYVEGSFRINGKEAENVNTRKQSNMPEYQWVSHYIQDKDLDPDNVGKVVITLSSYVDFINLSKTYNNRAVIRQISGGYRDATANVAVPQFGEKLGSIDSTGKKIIWTVDFNKENYNLGNVTVLDKLENDLTGRIPQEFTAAYFQRMKNGEWGAKENVTPTVTEKGHKFAINDVSERVLLTIETAIEPDGSPANFENDAFLYWNGEVNYKAKLHAKVRTSPIGGGSFGSISKTANAQVLTEDVKKYYAYKGEYIGPQPEWTVRADKSTVPAPGEYYMYDTFIFDKNTVPNRSEVNSANGYTIKKVGDTGVTELANGAKFDTIIPLEGKKQKLINVENPVTVSTAGITSAVYEIVKNEKVVGHILELKLVPGVDNFAKFSSMIADKDILTQWYSGGDEKAGYNTIMLTKGRYVTYQDSAYYRYNSKLISKQVISAKTARNFLKNLDAEATNADVFDDNEKIDVKQNDVGYDRDTRTVVFRINVNAANIKDVYGDLGPVILDDTSLSNYSWDRDFTFVPIVEDKLNPENNKEILIYKGVPAIKYEGTNDPDYRIGNSTVKAVGNALSDEELKKEDIVINPNGKPSEGFQVAFNKLNGPYVVFVKIKVKEGNRVNNKGTVYNHARIYIGSNSLVGQDYSWYDDRFLWKNYDGQDSKDKINVDDNGFIKWNVFYRPYKTYNDNNATKIKIEDKINGNLVLRKEKNSSNLVFDGDNYKIWKGEFDKDGNFINPVEVTDAPNTIFTYNNETGIMSINIPDNDSSYKISYITDFADNAARGDDLSNEVKLIENGETVGKSVKVTHQVKAEAYGHVNNKPYERIQIIKTDVKGNQLAGAEFSFKKLATAANPERNIGTFTTSANKAIKFEELTAGEYELVETKAPEGYESNNVTYRIKVIELENGFKVELIGDYAGLATLEQNELKIINKKIDKVTERLNLIKTDADGNRLAGAEFTLKKLGATTDAAVEVGKYTSVTDEAIRIENLTAGEYELVETKAPEGYVVNKEPYKIKVVKVEGGFKAELVGDYVEKAKLLNNELTVMNKKKPVTPPTPEKPVVPPTPENPTPLIPVNPTTPNTPNPTPSIPSYPINNTPNPNDPNSPDEFEVIGNDGTPQGKVVKKTKPNGEKEYIFEKDKTPLDGFKAKKSHTKALPKTGGASTVWYYAAGMGLVVMAGFTFRKRKEEE